MTARYLLMALFLISLTDSIFGQRLGVLDHRTPAYVQFSEPAIYTASEDEGEAVITVIRTGEYREAVSVQYATKDGTARAGEDYTATSGTLLIPAGVGFATFVVPIHLDDRTEGVETVHLELFDARPNGFITQGIGILHIADATQSNPASALSLTLCSDGKGKIMLRWPAQAEDCVLEKTQDPASGHWVVVNEVPAVAEGHCMVVEDASAGRSFYRLRVP